MMKLLVLIPSFLIASLAFSQNKNFVDSISAKITEFQNLNLKDSLLNANEELTFHYFDNYQDSLCSIQAKKTIALVHRDSLAKRIALQHIQAKALFFSTQKFEEPIKILSLASDSIEYLKENYLLKAKVWDTYGSILSNYSRHEEAFDILRKSEEAYLKCSPIPESLITIYSNLVATSRLKGSLMDALAYSRKGIDFAKQKNIPDQLGTLYYNYAAIYSSLDMYEDAISSLEKALTYLELSKSEWDIAVCKSALANCYTVSNSEKDLTKAIEIFSESIAELKRLEDPRYVAFTETLMANAYKGLKHYDKALDCINSSINYSEGAQDEMALTGTYLEKGRILIQMNQTDSAELYIKESLKLSQKTGDKYNESGSFLSLSELYRKTNDYVKALEFTDKHYHLKDSLALEELDQKIAKEQTLQNLEGEQKARQNAELEAQISQERERFYLILTLGLLVVLSFLSYLFLQLRKTRKILESQNKELLNLNHTKDKFFGIVAHDLRSPMTALEGVGEQMDFYLEKGNTDKLKRLAGRVDSTTKNLSNLLNNLLNWSLIQTGQVPYHPKQLELYAIIEDTTSLFQELAEAKEIQLTRSLYPPIMVNADEAGVSAVLRNLISNALKFTKQGGTVDIQVTSKKDETWVYVKDTGVGMSTSKVEKLFTLNKKSEKGTQGEKGTGLGLLLCKELIELNKGRISVSSKLNEGTTFSFTLPNR